MPLDPIQLTSLIISLEKSFPSWLCLDNRYLNRDKTPPTRETTRPMLKARNE